MTVSGPPTQRTEPGTVQEMKGAEISSQNKDAMAEIDNCIQQMLWVFCVSHFSFLLLFACWDVRDIKGQEVKSLQRTHIYELSC